MKENFRKLTVFAASPNDVSGHREALRAVIDELNHTTAGDLGIVLQLLTWQDVAPGMGRPEQVILDQIGDFDIFIGIMGRRFGSPTGKYEAGTEEEFHTAYQRWEQSKRPDILFYFNKELAPLPTSKEEMGQLSAVLTFRDTIEKLGLVKEYAGRDELCQFVRRDLTTVIKRFGSAPVSPVKVPAVKKAPIEGDYWEVWRDAALEERLPGETVASTVYRTAQHSIKYLTISGRSIYSGNIEEILSQKPATFNMKLLLFDWNSPQLPAKMRDERRNSDVLIELARQKANSIARQFLFFAQSLQLNLEIKLYREYPFWRILIADNVKAYMGYYPKNKRGYEGPMFVFDADDNSTLFHPVNYYFDRLWAQAGNPLTPDDARFNLLPLADLRPDDA